MGMKRMAKALAAEVGLGRVQTVVIHDASTKDMFGRLAIVTGGTSGIGLAIARRFCQSGALVVLVGTNAAKGKAALESIDGGASYIQANVSSLDEVSRAYELIKREYDGKVPDILVNCAGVNSDQHFPDISETEFDRVMSVNLKGALLMSQMAAQMMIEAKVQGNILNVSSVSSYRPATGPYEISKWGMRGLTVGMADDLIKYGIVVNAIAPGPTATPMLSKNDTSDLKLGWNPSGRMADPREIAELASVLVSDAGRLIVGDTLCASGGGGVVSLHR